MPFRFAWTEGRSTQLRMDFAFRVPEPERLYHWFCYKGRGRKQVSLEARAGWSFVLDDPARILVADDDPILREFAKVHLSTPVAGVELAADGGQAWERLRAETFDLALLDIEMPGIDGFELVRRIRADSRLQYLPVVMVTGREDIASIDRAFALGATSFVTKPVNWRQLSYQLRYVLRTNRSENEARAARDSARELSALKDSILSTLRHEFRTPLHAIIGFADILTEERHGPLDPEYRGHAEFIKTAGKNLLSGLMNMMSYSQLIADGFRLAEDEYDLRELVGAAVKTGLADLPESRITIVMGLHQGIDPGLSLTCDSEQFIRMLSHLLRNALVHGAAPIELTVAAPVAGDLILEVSDQGPGIPDAMVARCLQPFLQADMSHARQQTGIGLGLPISARIAELHGGSLTVTSTEGSGTSVRVTIPRDRLVRERREASLTAPLVGSESAA